MQQTKNRITAVREQLISTCIQNENIAVPKSMIREVIQDWSLATKQKGPDRVRAMLQNVVNKIIVNPDYSITIQLKIVCLELVPRTGIEPVRRSLSEGF
jgi:mannitol/fructose-specific phosphotransferase system IIA component (Ntr-type)